MHYCRQTAPSFYPVNHQSVVLGLWCLYFSESRENHGFSDAICNKIVFDLKEIVILVSGENASVLKCTFAGELPEFPTSKISTRRPRSVLFIYAGKYRK